MKPIEVSSQSDLNKLKSQKIIDKISKNYNELSVSKKLRLLKRTERRLSKGVRKLDRMSETKFQKKFHSMLENKKATNKVTELDSEECAILKGIDTNTNMGNVSADKFLFTQKIEESIFSIREEMDTLKKGEKKLTVTSAVIYGLIAGLVVLSFFSSTALVILGIVLIAFVALFSLVLLVGLAFAEVLGNIVGQMKMDEQLN